MKNILLLVLALMLVLTACTTARQKLTPQGNLFLKSANVYYQQKNVEKAFDYYNKVLTTNPDYVIALKRIADINLYNATEMPDRSVEFNKSAYIYYDKTLTVLATFPALSEEEKATKRDAIKKKEAAWARIFNAGKDQLLAQKYPESLKTMDILYALDKTRVEPLKLMVSIYQEQKDDANVAVYLEKILKINPNDPDIIKMMGSHYFNAKDYANAVVYFNKIKTTEPRDVNNLLLLSRSYFELKQSQNALNELKLVLAIEPDNIDAIYDARTNASSIPDAEQTIFYAKLLVEKVTNTEGDERKDNIAFLVVKLNDMKRYSESMPYAEMWYEMDTTQTEVATLCLFIAQQIGNKDLITKYANITKTLK